MSRGDPHLDLTRPLQGGVYDVPAADYAEAFARAANGEAGKIVLDWQSA